MRKLRQPNAAGFVSETAPAVHAEEPKKKARKKAEAEAVVAEEPVAHVVEDAPVEVAVEAPAEPVVEQTEEKPAETESL